MSVNQHPTKGPGWWQIRYRPGGAKGKQEAIVFPGTRDEAVMYEHQLRLEARGSRPLSTLPKLTEVVPEFMRHYELDHLPAGIYNMRRYMRRFVEFFGGQQLASITTPDVERYKHHRLSLGISRSTINKETSGLNKLLEYGASHGYCLAMKTRRFPAKFTKAPLPDVPTREECLAFIHVLDWPACGFFACLYYAGLRKAEAAYMTAENVYLARGLMIVRGKGNKQRAVPIAVELRPFLERRLSEVSTGYIWTNSAGKPLYAVKSHVYWGKKRAGLDRPLYPHLMRHAFGTHSTMAGIGIRSLQRMMGHTTSQTTEIYTTLSDQFLVEEIQKFKG